MRQALWLAFQTSIVGFWLYVYSDIAEHDGTKFHVGQAFMIGIVMAFLATIAVKFIAGLLRLIREPVADSRTRNAPDEIL